MFDLILSSYRERRPERDAEYRRCLEENLANPWISRIFVFYEDPGEELPARFEHPKIEVFPHGGKALSFRRMFDLAAERSAGALEETLQCSAEATRALAETPQRFGADVDLYREDLG